MNTWFYLIHTPKGAAVLGVFLTLAAVTWFVGHRAGGQKVRAELGNARMPDDWPYLWAIAVTVAAIAALFWAGLAAWGESMLGGLGL